MARRLAVLFAAELLDPPVGGAERWALEVLERLRARHDVRTTSLEASGNGRGYWQEKAARREAVGTSVERLLAERRADVVVTQLHAAPAVVRAARNARAPTVLVIPSYESLCKLAFDAGSACRPASRCRDCPAAVALATDERRALEASRDEHQWSLRNADELVVHSSHMAEVCERWCGRRPHVIPGSATHPPPVRADPEGPVVAVARWNVNKGVALLEPIARRLDQGRLRVTERGAPAGVHTVPEAPLTTLLDGAAALIVPSQWPEPFGRVAFEGMAAGVPTLASATGGLRDIVPSQELVRDYAEPAAWVAAISTLRNETRWQAACQRGLSAARRLLAVDPAVRFEKALYAAADRRRATALLRG